MSSITIKFRLLLVAKLDLDLALALDLLQAARLGWPLTAAMFFKGSGPANYRDGLALGHWQHSVSSERGIRIKM